MKYEQYRSIETHQSKETENHNRILVITGLSGSGKDYLIDKLVQNNIVPPEISTYSFGEKLFQEIKKIFPALTNRDQMWFQLSNYDLILGINRAIEQILQEQPVLLNTQVVYKQGMSLTTNPCFDKKIQAGGYVFVWTDPEQIFQQRILDISRDRPQEKVEDIAINQSIALVVTNKIARLNESAFHTLENRLDNVKNNVNSLSEYLQEATSKY